MSIPWFYLPNPDTRGVNRTFHTHAWLRVRGVQIAPQIYLLPSPYIMDVYLAGIFDIYVFRVRYAWGGNCQKNVNIKFFLFTLCSCSASSLSLLVTFSSCLLISFSWRDYVRGIKNEETATDPTTDRPNDAWLWHSYWRESILRESSYPTKFLKNFKEWFKVFNPDFILHSCLYLQWKVSSR